MTGFPTCETGFHTFVFGLHAYGAGFHIHNAITYSLAQLWGDRPNHAKVFGQVLPKSIPKPHSKTTLRRGFRKPSPFDSKEFSNSIPTGRGFGIPGLVHGPGLRTCVAGLRFRGAELRSFGFGLHVLGVGFCGGRIAPLPANLL